MLAAVQVLHPLGLFPPMLLVTQDVMEGYQSLSSQLLQDYNAHSATVIGQPVPTATAASKAGVAGPSSSAAAATAGGVEDGEMTDAEAQRYRQNAGKLRHLSGVCSCISALMVAVLGQHA